MRIERHVEQMSELATGEIRLGVGPIIEQVLLPELLLRFVELTGNVRFSIFTDHAEKLLARLHSADLDIIAGPFRAAEHPDLAGFPLIEDSFTTVARAGHPIFSDKNEAEIKSFAIASPVPEGAVTGGALAQSHGGPMRTWSTAVSVDLLELQAWALASAKKARGYSNVKF